MSIWDHLRSTEARIEAMEFEQAAERQRKAAEKKLKPKLKALEKVAAGIVRAQDLQERHELKKRVGRLHRRVHGWNEYEQDDAKRELAHAAEVAQREARRNKEATEPIKAAEREQRWRLERGRILTERNRLRREAEDSGGTIGWLDPGPLPAAAPDWFEGVQDGVRVTVHKPSVPQPVHNPDGTVTLAFDQDVITGRPPGPELLTPEAQFAEAEER